MGGLGKTDLFADGIRAMRRFCEANDLRVPEVSERTGTPDFGVCAYYRDNVITIWVAHCAAIGLAGRAWSYPGYTVDRTPFGVLAHELGHHVDGAQGPRGGRLSHEWRHATNEEPISGYAPNNNEWFAELFRLYVTNPDLLRVLRPRVYSRMRETWQPIEERPWDVVLAAAPRQLAAARNKIPRVKQ